MKKLATILAALLVACVPTVTLFASCKKGPTEGGTTPVTDPGNELQQEGRVTFDENGVKYIDGETVEQRLEHEFSPNIPEEAVANFEGKTFSMLIGSTGQVMYAEEENGSTINDEVFRRNKLIEDHFGITLNIVKTGAASTGTGQAEATATFRSLIETGDTTYNAFLHVQHTGMPQMILEKCFVDWNKLPYVSLVDNWWYGNIQNDLCFGDKIYVMTGDYALYIDKIDCLVFNKSIFDELGLDYPYKDVLDGTWTWDKFEELVAQGSVDLDGDGLITYENDRWGLLGWAPELNYALLVSTGYAPLEKDANNMPILNQNTELANEMYGRVVNLFANRKDAWSESRDGFWTSQLNTFKEGRVMFYDTFLSGVPSFSEVEFDFGILPYPKWDEDSPYYNRSSNMTALTYIPVTNQDLPLTGAVLEELAFQSAKGLTPLYFEDVLTVKSTRDVESEEMLPIIKDNARFLYDGYMPNLYNMVSSGTNNFASSYQASVDKYKADLETMRELLNS